MEESDSDSHGLPPIRATLYQMRSNHKDFSGIYFSPESKLSNTEEVGQKESNSKTVVKPKNKGRNLYPEFFSRSTNKSLFTKSDKELAFYPVNVRSRRRLHEISNIMSEDSPDKPNYNADDTEECDVIAR